MKRHTAAFLACMFLLAMLPACTQQKAASTTGKAYYLYYEIKDLSTARGGDAMGRERTSVEPAATQNTRRLARTLINRLLEGPKTKRLSAVIPEGTVLLSLQQDGEHITVNLSAAYGSLSGIELSMADYSIALTLVQIPGIQTVSVTVRGQELAYREIHNFSSSDVLRSSREDVMGTVTVSLYFLKTDGTLSAERRSLELYEGDTQAQAVLQAMQKGPESAELLPVLPNGFTVHSIWTEDDVCCVNLSTAALKKLPQNADLKTALRALSRSLRSLGSVDSVRYLVDGKSLNTYGGVSINGK